MHYKVIWSAKAIDLLDQAIRFIAMDRPSAAETYRQRVHETVDQLIQLPYLGASFEDAPSRIWRELFCDPYRIFYRVIESRKQIYIALFWHASREEPTRDEFLA